MLVQQGMNDVCLTTAVNKSVDFSWIRGWLWDVWRRDPCRNIDVFPSYAISILMRSHAAGAHARNSWTGGRRGRKVKRGGRGSMCRRQHAHNFFAEKPVVVSAIHFCQNPKTHNAPIVHMLTHFT